MTQDDDPLDFKVRCPRCLTEYDVVEGQETVACEVCECDAQDVIWELVHNDVPIVINWHVLRILCMWAEFYAVSVDRENPQAKGETLQRTVARLAGRIAAQHPELALESPLTMSGEIASLREAFPEATIEVIGFNEDVEANGQEETQ